MFQDEIGSCAYMTILVISVSNKQDPKFVYLLWMPDSLILLISF